VVGTQVMEVARIVRDSICERSNVFGRKNLGGTLRRCRCFRTPILFHLLHFFPTQRFRGFQNGVGHLVGGEAVFECRTGHFACSSLEIGGLMGERSA
jgi:hypothetical protein